MPQAAQPTAAFDAAIAAVSQVRQPREAERVPGAHYCLHVFDSLRASSKRLERRIAITTDRAEVSRLIDEKVAIDMRETVEHRRARGLESGWDAATRDLGRAMSEAA